MTIRKLIDSERWRLEINREGFRRIRKTFVNREDAERFERRYLRKPKTVIETISNRICRLTAKNDKTTTELEELRFCVACL